MIYNNKPGKYLTVHVKGGFGWTVPYLHGVGFNMMVYAVMDQEAWPCDPLLVIFYFNTSGYSEVFF